MDDVKQEFKKRLIDEMNYQGISSRDFAQQVGISSSTLGMYLYRGSMPAADVAVRMAQALHTTAEYLVLGTEASAPVPRQNTKSDWQKKEVAAIVASLSAPQLTHFLEIARAYKSAVTASESE